MTALRSGKISQISASRLSTHSHRFYPTDSDEVLVQKTVCRSTTLASVSQISLDENEDQRSAALLISPLGETSTDIYPRFPFYRFQVSSLA